MIAKLRLLFWLGIIMIFLSFFGIPNTWKAVIAILVGIALIITCANSIDHCVALSAILSIL
jgi:hypothetical protein